MRHCLALIFTVSMAIACSSPGSDEPPTGSAKADGAACASDDGLLSCLSVECPGLADEDLSECFVEHCEEVGQNSPESCQTCFVNAFVTGGDTEEIVAACAGSGEPAAPVCDPSEPMFDCMNDNCPDIVGEELDQCFSDNCEQVSEETPIECALCGVEAFEAGMNAAEITALCAGAGDTPAVSTGIACAQDDLALFVCMDDNCANAEGNEAIGQCIADSCADEAQTLAMSCMVCVQTELDATDSSDAGLEVSCTAADSAPCDVDKAAVIRSCADTQCAGQQGDALDQCMDQECPEVFDGVSEQCGQCVVALHTNGVPFSPAVASCAGR